MKTFSGLVLLLIFNFNLLGQCHLENTTFGSGEKLKYTLYYNLKFIWLELADIELTTKSIKYKGQNCLKISSLWKTRPKYSWILKVDDRFEAIMNKDTRTTKRFLKFFIQFLLCCYLITEPTTSICPK